MTTQGIILKMQTRERSTLEKHSPALTLLFYRELQQVAQQGCGVSIFKEIENPNGEDPEQPALVDPARNRERDKSLSRGPIQPQPLSDSVDIPCSEMQQISSIFKSGSCICSTDVLLPNTNY